MRFSAIWAAVCRVWLSWESRLLRIEVLSPTPFSLVPISEFCCEGVCPSAASEARRRSVRERILSQTDSSSRDRRRCSSVNCLWKEEAHGLNVLISYLQTTFIPQRKQKKLTIMWETDEWTQTLNYCYNTVIFKDLPSSVESQHCVFCHPKISPVQKLIKQHLAFQ